MKKEVKKARCSAKGHLLYEYAQCYKNSNDSVYKGLLSESLAYLRACYENRPRQYTLRTLFICAEISFILKDIAAAESYFTKAFAHIDRTAEIRPLDYYNFAMFQYSVGRFENAVTAFETYRLLVPNDRSIDDYLEKAKENVR